MNVRDEIAKYADEKNKPCLIWLFDHYHMASQWNFVAFCQFVGTYPHSHRVWEPTYEGYILYTHENGKEGNNDSL